MQSKVVTPVAASSKRLLMVDRGDVEAVANHRLNRAESSKTNIVGIVMVVLVLLGYFLWRQVSTAIGIGLVVVAGAILFGYFYYLLPKKQKVAREALLKEWRGQK